jgi:hypothetical protein
MGAVIRYPAISSFGTCPRKVVLAKDGKSPFRQVLFVYLFIS